MDITRRNLLAASSSLAFAQAQETSADWIAQIVARYDAGVERLLKQQITDPKHRWRGISPDDLGVFHAPTGTGYVDTLVAAFLHPQSKFHKDPVLIQRAKLAAELLTREQNADGNIDNPLTNFNSPADLAFVVRGLCPAAILAKRGGLLEVTKMLDPFLRKAGSALTKGGIHTPNHRWVLCAALAQLNEIYNEPAYVRRIDQWLAETIDIDSDGQYTERSTHTYNPITDAAFVVMASKLKRPELLDPVRKNIESMMYLIHPGYEVVTEFSRRQDLNTSGDMGAYWFTLAYLSAFEKDGRCTTLARHFAASRGSLSALLEYPELTKDNTQPKPIPDDYQRVYPHNQVARVRRGLISATVLTQGRNRFFGLRNGDAVINAVRFASNFFGKGQFVPTESEIRGSTVALKQSLSAPYYQPLDPTRVVTADDWEKVRPERKQTEINKLEQSVTIVEINNGFRLRIQSQGTKDVPLSVEINLRPGGTLEGADPAPRVTDGWLFTGKQVVFRMGKNAIRIGPGVRLNSYTQMHGAEPKLAGPSLYLTGSTPFDHTIEFECL